MKRLGALQSRSDRADNCDFESVEDPSDAKPDDDKKVKKRLQGSRSRRNGISVCTTPKEGEEFFINDAFKIAQPAEISATPEGVRRQGNAAKSIRFGDLVGGGLTAARGGNALSVTRHLKAKSCRGRSNLN